MSQLDQAILNTYRDLLRQPKVLNYLQELEQKMAELSEQIASRHQELNQIEERLKWLETAPLRSLKEWLWKNQEAQYQEWKAGYFERVMEYKGLVKELELCEFEYGVLKAQISNESEKRAHLKKLLDEKGLEVLMEDSPANTALREWYEEIMFKYSLLEEIRESYFQGEKALHALNGLLHRLYTARQDQGEPSSRTHLLFYLEGAQSEIEETYRQLQRYLLELKDISSEKPVDRYDDLLSAGNFIGNLYKALLTYPNQHFLKNTINRLVKIKNRLVESNQQLQKEQGFTERSIKRLRRKRELLLIRESRLDLREEE